MRDYMMKALMWLTTIWAGGLSFSLYQEGDKLLGLIVLGISCIIFHDSVEYRNPTN